MAQGSIEFIMARLKKMNFNPILRTCKLKAGPIITDNNNYILDVAMNIENPEGVEKYSNYSQEYLKLVYLIIKTPKLYIIKMDKSKKLLKFTLKELLKYSLINLR